MTTTVKPGTRVTTPASGPPAVVEADVAVIGAGPAGIAAAARAAEAGRRVVIVDEAPNVGGQIWRHRARATLDVDARRWLDRLGRTQAHVMRGLAVVDVVRAGDRGGFTVVAERHRGGVDVVRATALVLATGARERFVPFPGWTLAGVTGIGGAQALLKQGATVRGKRAVIAGSGPLLLPVAASLVNAGARVVLVAEQAPSAAVREFALSLVWHPDTLLQAALYRLAFIRTPYALGTWVTEALGSDRVTSVTVSNGRTSRTIACDLVCTGYGLVPNVELARLLDCPVTNGVVRVGARQETAIPGVYAAGEVTGVGGVALAVVEGEIAGAAAAGVSRLDASLVRRRAALRAIAERMARTFAVRREIAALARDDTIVCRCEDVRRGTVASLGDSRQAKLYTRAGMGACQGRVCGPALETLFGWPAGAVRPPLEPARLSTLSIGASALGAAVSVSSGSVNSSSGA